MKHPIKNLVLTASTLLTACSPSLNEEQALLTDAEKKSCFNDEGIRIFKQEFEAMQSKKWDIDQLACGSVYAYEDASNSLVDIELKLIAVGTQINYLDALDKLFPKIYQAGDKAKKLALRWEAAKSRSLALLDSVSLFDGVVAEVNMLKGIYLLVSTTQNTAVKQQLAALPKAKKLLDAGYESNNEILNGMGRIVLGRLYIDLPSFAGGNMKQGLAMLEKAKELDPDNMELSIMLGKAYLALGDEEMQKQILQSVAKQTTENINSQDLVDWAYTLGGMASRLDMKNELSYFSKLRHSTLNQMPHLLPRKTTAELGHGGADPITGKDLNEI